MDGLGDNWLQGQGEGSITGKKEGRKAQPHNAQIHHLLQLLGLLLQLPPLSLCEALGPGAESLPLKFLYHNLHHVLLGHMQDTQVVKLGSHVLGPHRHGADPQLRALLAH